MKKLKRKNKQNTSISTICIAILLMLLVILFLFFRENIFRNEKDKEALKNLIIEKEKSILDLMSELNRIKALHEVFRNEAIRVFRLLKIVIVFAILLASFICSMFFNVSIWGSIAGMIAGITLIYKTTTIVMQNKIADFNTALISIEAYFIERGFRKNSFEPTTIAIIEQKLNTEKNELEFLKVEYGRELNSAKFSYLDK